MIEYHSAAPDRGLSTSTLTLFFPFLPRNVLVSYSLRSRDLENTGRFLCHWILSHHAERIQNHSELRKEFRPMMHSRAKNKQLVSLPSGARAGALRSFLVLTLVAPHRQTLQTPRDHINPIESLPRCIPPFSFTLSSPSSVSSFPFPRIAVLLLSQLCQPQRPSPSPTLASSPTRLTSFGSPSHNPVSRRSRKAKVSRKARSQSGSKAPGSAGAFHV